MVPPSPCSTVTGSIPPIPGTRHRTSHHQLSNPLSSLSHPAKQPRYKSAVILQSAVHTNQCPRIESYTCSPIPYTPPPPSGVHPHTHLLPVLVVSPRQPSRLDHWLPVVLSRLDFVAIQAVSPAANHPLPDRPFGPVGSAVQEKSGQGNLGGTPRLVTILSGTTQA